MTSVFRYLAPPESKATLVRVGPLSSFRPARTEGAVVVVAAAALSSSSHWRSFVRRACPEAVVVEAPRSRSGGDEGLKRIEFVETLWRRFAKAGLDRRGRVLIAGGGALLDAAGLAAALWHRGVDAWFVPTTLVSQVDAALGGKSALNLDAVKNQIGTTRQPSAILADPEFLKSEPKSSYDSGLGEVAKTALLAGGALERRVLRDAAKLRRRETAALRTVVLGCLRYKARIVAGDPEEARGDRLLLNAGHTLGHAIEAAAHAAGTPMPHGAAVAVGLCEEARITPGADFARVLRMIEALGLPSKPPFRIPFRQSKTLLRGDKKLVGRGFVRVARIPSKGPPDLVSIDPDTLARALT